MSVGSLRAAALAALSRQLRLSARHALSSASVARHARRQAGTSRVFREHRPYVPGDDVRQLDWRAFARTGRPLIKCFEDEAQLRLWVGLDVSPSLRFGEGRQHKLFWLAALAQALFELAARQDDAAGLFLLQQNAGIWPPKADVRQPGRLAAALSATLMDEGNQRVVPREASVTLPRHARRLPHRVVLLGDWLSDWCDSPAQGEATRLEALLRRCRTRGYKVDVVQALHADEAQFPYRGATTFDGGAKTPLTTTDASAARDAYLANLADLQQRVSAACHEAGASYCLARTDAPMAPVLASLAAGKTARATRA